MRYIPNGEGSFIVNASCSDVDSYLISYSLLNPLPAYLSHSSAYPIDYKQTVYYNFSLLSFSGFHMNYSNAFVTAYSPSSFQTPFTLIVFKCSPNCLNCLYDEATREEGNNCTLCALGFVMDGIKCTSLNTSVVSPSALQGAQAISITNTIAQALAGLTSVGTLGSGMFISANANQLIRMMTFIGNP
jgi:hypothetical protein